MYIRLEEKLSRQYLWLLCRHHNHVGGFARRCFQKTLWCFGWSKAIKLFQEYSSSDDYVYIGLAMRNACPLDALNFSWSSTPNLLHGWRLPRGRPRLPCMARRSALRPSSSWDALLMADRLVQDRVRALVKARKVTSVGEGCARDVGFAPACI